MGRPRLKNYQPCFVLIVDISHHPAFIATHINTSYIAKCTTNYPNLALRTFQTAGPVRASTLYLSLALQDHQVKCRASRLKITVARSMTNFATFSCILCLKFRYVCIAWLLYIHFYVNCFLRLCLHYVWSVTNIDVGRGKMGANRFSWGPVTFQVYWPPGPVAPGA